MAGLITHFLVTREAIWSDDLDPGLINLLNANSDWVFLGSASPDLPYVIFIGDQAEWANHLHYLNTNALILAGQKLFNGQANALSHIDRIKLSWMLGYISHIITDVTIHPIIEGKDVVGPYSVDANKSPHRICEKVQDSLLFNELTRGLDITYAEYSDRFKNCARSNALSEVLTTWKNLLLGSYPAQQPVPDPNLWFNVFLHLFDSADNPGGVIAMFRHTQMLGEAFTREKVYDSKARLREKYPEDCKRYYDKIKLPSGETGTFKKDGFERAVKNVVEKWNKFYQSLSDSTIAIADIIPNWNLDTGQVIGVNGDITLWRA